MRSTITVPHRSHRNAARDAQAAPVPSSLPSLRYSPSKKDKHWGEATIAPSIPSITLAAVNADNATAVTAANPCKKIVCPLALIVDVSEPVSYALPAGVATFPVADIMPTAAPALPAKFLGQNQWLLMCPLPLWPTLVVTIAATSEAAAADVTVSTVVSANLATAEAAVADVPVPVAIAALLSASSAAVDLQRRQ